MKIGYVGLGKMGYNMALRLLEKGHDVLAYDANGEAREEAAKAGIKTVNASVELAEFLDKPRVIWLMVPHEAMDGLIKELSDFLQSGDTIIDGGNSPYQESMRRSSELAAQGIHFLDVGVSGGPEGARSGACLMIGGDRQVYDKLEALFRDISAEGGYGYMGIHGAGHFVKMVHNGIEYGMMQAIVEGFTLLGHSEFNLELEKVADLYNHRSVIESRLIGWLKAAFEEFGQDMEGVSGKVEQSGEGVWTAEMAKDLGVPVPVIEAAVRFRLDSERNPSYSGKLLSAMRNRFGGHKVTG